MRYELTQNVVGVDYHGKTRVFNCYSLSNTACMDSKNLYTHTHNKKTHSHAILFLHSQKFRIETWIIIYLGLIVLNSEQRFPTTPVITWLKIFSCLKFRAFYSRPLGGLLRYWCWIIPRFARRKNCWFRLNWVYYMDLTPHSQNDTHSFAENKWLQNDWVLLFITT